MFKSQKAHLETFFVVIFFPLHISYSSSLFFNVKTYFSQGKRRYIQNRFLDRFMYSRKKEAFLVRGTPCLKYIHRKKIKRRRSCFRVLSTDGAMVHVISHRD